MIRLLGILGPVVCEVHGPQGGILRKVFSRQDSCCSRSLMGTGSEVQLCVGAYETLVAEGIRARVVSMPCWELFEQQSPEYKSSVLPRAVRARVAVEAGTSLGWKEYVGQDGLVVGRSDFGASAPVKDVMLHFGFTVDNVVAKAREAMERVKGS